MVLRSRLYRAIFIKRTKVCLSDAVIIKVTPSLRSGVGTSSSLHGCAETPHRGCEIKPGCLCSVDKYPPMSCSCGTTFCVRAFLVQCKGMVLPREEGREEARTGPAQRGAGETWDMRPSPGQFCGPVYSEAVGKSANVCSRFWCSLFKLAHSISHCARMDRSPW